MIKITQEEQWAFNVLNSTVGNAEQEFQRALAARGAFIKMLEAKYDADFNPATGELKAKEKIKGKEK